MKSRDLDAGTGVCEKCGPVELGWKSRGAKGRQPRCANAIREQNQGPDGRNRWATVPREHGLTPEEARALREGKSCQICGATDQLAVDHCHVTGRIRGVLCRNHNTALGLFQDSVQMLAMAVVYLSGDRVFPVVSGTVSPTLSLLEGNHCG